MIEIDESSERIAAFCESAPETIEEFELALDVRASAKKLFDRYGCPLIEELPEDKDRSVVRELVLFDHSSTLANIEITEYSDGRLCVSAAFESDEYSDEDGQVSVGQMVISAEINSNNKLVDAATTIRGANYGTHCKDKFHMNRDDPVSRLAQTLEVLEAETEAYACSIDVGMEPVHNDIIYFGGAPEPRQIDLGVMLPEVALDTY